MPEEKIITYDEIGNEYIIIIESIYLNSNTLGNITLRDKVNEKLYVEETGQLVTRDNRNGTLGKDFLIRSLNPTRRNPNGKIAVSIKS